MLRAIAIGSIGLVVALCRPGVAPGQVSAGQPQVFTIEAILAPDMATADKVGYDPLSAGFVGGKSDEVRWLGILSARSINGDSFQGRQIVESLQGNQPNLLVSGKDDLLSKFRGAAMGSQVVLQGMLIPQSRNYMLDKVDVRPPAAKN
ncbi:MAG: hypothetical protein ACREQL_09010 [Candidatus Binatia bacterium]